MAKRKELRKGINTLPLYVLLLIVFVLYVYYQQVPTLAFALGLALFFTIAVLVALELINSVREAGYKRNLIELVVAVGIIVLFWFGLKFILHTNYPLDVVPSCSMLPNLHIGDMVILQGIGGVSQIKAPVVSVSQTAYANMISNFDNEQYSCVVYRYVGNAINISQYVGPGYSIGLYQSSAGGGAIIQQGQQTGLISYTCGARNVRFNNGTVLSEAYTTAITIAGTTIIGDANNTVVVYQTTPYDLFYRLGDRYIVHRVYAVIDAGGSYYTLTKGDNNPGLDIQYGNRPATFSDIEGRVIADIPYLGYLNLVLRQQFSQPAGCNSTVV